MLQSSPGKIVLKFKRLPMKYLRLIKNIRNVSTSIDQQEIKQFQKLHSDWWDEYGPMKPLHSLNKLRVPFIRDGLNNTGALTNYQSSKPLSGVSILDVGCGGGILSEPLNKIGASVHGLDASTELIEQAKTHALKLNLKNISYSVESVEEHAEHNKEKYDAVVASEVVEHITNKNEFINSCVKCLKPEGSIFITTINQTTIAWFAGIILSEDVLGLLPKGTHHYDKFIEPHKLQRILEDENCRTLLVHGLYYNVLTNEWFWCTDHSINYALHAAKLPQKNKT